MAELNEAESTKDAKKTKKEKKMEEKAAKKAAKKAKKNHEADKPDAENDDSDSVSSKIVMVLVTILIIAIWLGIFAVFVKADVGGFGSTVLAPALKDVPVLSKILPDSGNITASESTETAGYTNLDDAVSRIKELEKQLDEAKINILKSFLGEEYNEYITLKKIKATRGIQARLPYDLKPL